ncbi:MAG: chromosome segregation protein SMC, partial [Acidimicrobiia bacterium]|nr:chromosome segregation protein SMC [Acidimicrobiia bacterium]
ELESIVRRRDSVTDRLDHERSEMADLQDQIEALDSETGAVTDRYRAVAETRSEAEIGLENARSVLNAADVDLARALARHEAIEAALSGVLDPEATETALKLDGVAGTIVSRLAVPPELAVAVDAALGSWRTGLAATDREAAASAVQDLKSRGLGGIGLVGIGDRGSEVPARAAAKQWGVPALVDLLGAEADRRLAETLLGDVVVVEGWSAAIRIVDQMPHIRAVTPEGDLIAADGFVLASVDGAGPAALEAAAVGIEEAERHVARARSAHTTAQREFQHAHDAEREAAEALESVESRLAGSTEALVVFGRSIAAAEDEVSRLEERNRALHEAGALRDERLSQLQDRIADLEGEEAERHEAWEALHRRREDVARRREEARQLREEAAAASAGIEERRRLLTARVATIETELAAPDDVEVDPLVIDRLADIEDHAGRTVDEARRHVEALRTRQRDLRETAGIADGKLAQAYDRTEHLDESISKARERLSGLEIELAELRVRDEATCEGLRRDADSDETAALEAPRPDLPEDENLPERLASVEAQLRRMGPINPLAATEYRELAEQTDLLETQLEDLEESKRELKKVITALDDEMAISFREAFADISRLYEENFGLVFPGGKGGLRLTDPDRPLESGVEIEAQPLGKKVGRLSLLSGGERSLAALAFLFAVFRARPSPFYVLDEVEAALDDANLRRFLRLIDGLGLSTQLVIITHQQQTMESADVLYGVTMEPAESSIVVSKRLEARADSTAAPVSSS